MPNKIILTMLFILLMVYYILDQGQSQQSSIKSLGLNNNKTSIEFVPAWAKSAIWYQIFPERFRDGDHGNNPTMQDILGADPAEKPMVWRIHPWGSDWYQLQDYELQNAEPELWKHLLRRRYGGDLQGIIDKIDYLKDLGVNAIYLNPVFDSPSLHKYDAASYHHIDPNFGPNPADDRLLIAKENPQDPRTWVWTSADKLMLELINKLHQNKIKVIFDGVFNHMGISSFAFKDLEQKQRNSAYASWFNVISFKDSKKQTNFEYEGWYGVKSLPVWKEDKNGLVEGPKNYIFSATKRWMNPDNKGTEFGIDGWRLDVAFEVSHLFWKSWRKHVKKINPDAYLTAEIVDEPENVTPYFQGDEFDGEMNYNFAFALAEFMFNPKPTRISASQLDTKLEKLRTLYPKGVSQVTQNLFNSHDSNRLGSHIVNRGIGNFRDWNNYFTLSKAAENPNYNVRKPNLKEIALQKLFVIFQMTYVGAPMIYYGDEVGMWGGNDPDSRKPMLWSDIFYKDEVFLPNGNRREASLVDKVQVNDDLLKHYKKMIHIRNTYPVLQFGQYKTIATYDKKGVFIFKRYDDTAITKHVIIAINNSKISATVKIDRQDNHCYRNLLESNILTTKTNQFNVTIKPKWAVILVPATKGCHY
ncbi:MAG: glycoside hydrolase family 13 protein [Enterobacterales bacterium]|nr:glycoside hydrolase family 13 protein [Enterobacterales bacterium]